MVETVPALFFFAAGKPVYSVLCYEGSSYANLWRRQYLNGNCCDTQDSAIAADTLNCSGQNDEMKQTLFLRLAPSNRHPGNKVEINLEEHIYLKKADHFVGTAFFRLARLLGHQRQAKLPAMAESDPNRGVDETGYLCR